MVKRNTVTNCQRSALFVKQKSRAHLFLIQFQLWFEGQVNNIIDFSSISRIDFAKYDWLDTVKYHQPNYRTRRTES